MAYVYTPSGIIPDSEAFSQSFEIAYVATFSYGDMTAFESNH
jgi:hypothetical protein